MYNSFKEEILQFWSKSLKAAVNAIKDKFCKKIIKKSVKETKPKKSVRKTITFNPRRKILKSNRGDRTIKRAKKISVIDQTFKVVNESEAQPVNVELLNKKESILTETGINEILKENENNFFKKEEENLTVKKEKIETNFKNEKSKFYSRIAERNDLKKSFLQKKFRQISEIDSNNYIPKTEIPEINHGDEMSLELAFDSPLWAKNPNLIDLVYKQDHAFLESKFSNRNSVDIVSIFPKIKNLSNDSPNKWNKK